MSIRPVNRAARRASLALLAAIAVFSPAATAADDVPANADAWQTRPGDASIVLPAALGGATVLMEGAEFSPPGTSPYYPLTAAEVTRLNALAPNLGLVSYQLEWVDPHGSVVGPTSMHKVGQELVPVLNTTPNFDTVVQRLSTVSFTGAGQSQETAIRILMLDLQSVAPVLIGGFHYEVVAILANGSPVYDPADSANPQYTGNLKLNSTAITPAGVTGTLDMGVTGPTPTAANLGANLPAGMLGLPVSFDLLFIPLDGGPAIPGVKDEVIFQNPSLGTFSALPEPSGLVLLLTSSVLVGGLALRRARSGRS